VKIEAIFGLRPAGGIDAAIVGMTMIYGWQKPLGPMQSFDDSADIAEGIWDAAYKDVGKSLEYRDLMEMVTTKFLGCPQ